MVLTSPNAPCHSVPSTDTQPVSTQLTCEAENFLSKEIGFIDHPSFRKQPLTEDDESGVLPAIERGQGDHLWKENNFALPAHLRRMCNRPILTATEERDLFRRMNYLKYQANVLRTQLSAQFPCRDQLAAIEDVLQRAERIRNHIILSNIRLVISIAKNFSGKETTFDMTLSTGICSLMNVVDKFNFDRGFRFSTYATRAIRRDLYRLVIKNHSQLQRFCTGSDELVESCIEKETSRLPAIHHRTVYATLQNMLNLLAPRERRILQLRFGFDNDDGHKVTYSTIAREFGISKERVRQIAKRALDHLREMAPDFSLDSFLS
jgi:RNA polymerase primary sigma factor